MLDALVRIAGATTIVNTAKGFSVNEVTQAPVQERVTSATKSLLKGIEVDSYFTADPRPQSAGA